MLLVEIFALLNEYSEEEVKRRVRSLENKIIDIDEKIKEQEHLARIANAKGRSPLPHNERILKLKNEKKEFYQEKKAIEATITPSEEAKKASTEREKARAAETEEQKKARHGKAIGAGLKHGAELRKDEGDVQDWSKLASKVHNYVVKASNEGKVKLTAGDIAHEFDTTARTANKWLERPEFTKTARLMGRR